MSLLLMSRQVRGRVAAAPPGGTYDIDVEFHRFDAGTGTTLTAWGVELAEGELLAANIADVSVWREDVEIPVYVAALGKWPDGTARSLYIQSSQSLTAGTPVVGGINLTGGFGEARLSYTDDSADWVNNEAVAETFRVTGLPAGVITPVDPVRLCAATSFGILTPQSSQTNFTVGGYTSEDVDTNMETNWITVGMSRNTGSAEYERQRVTWHKFCRTGDIDYLKGTAAALSWKRYTYWWDGSGFVDLPEAQQDQMAWCMEYFFKYDTAAKTKADFMASLIVSEGTWDYTAGGRMMARRIAYATASVMMGASATDTVNTQLPKYTITGASATDHWYGDKIQFAGFINDGVTLQATSYSYMACVMMQRLIELYYALPAGASRTTIAARISDGLDWYIANMQAETSATPSATGFSYCDVVNYYGRQQAEIVGTYTSGATTLSLRSMVTGSGGARVYAGSFVWLNGVMGTVSSDNNDASGGTWTLTLTAGGVASSAVDGDTVYVVQNAAQALGAAGPDLFGFWPALLAWDWAINADTTSRDLAKEMYVTLGRAIGAGGGPYVTSDTQSNKQYQEAFNCSQQTPAILALRA